MPLEHKVPKTLLDSLFQCLTTLSEESSPNVQSEPLLTQLCTVPLHSVISYQGEETDTSPSASPPHNIVESNEVPFQPPFLQPRQTKYPQTLLKGEYLLF